MTPELLYALPLGYLFGSIPFGLVLTRLAGKGDVREIGSGNIGATNVLRAGGMGLAAATLVLDCLKATAAILLAGRLWPGSESFAAAGALIGHLYPVWLKFKGGKGVATFLGVLLAVAWQGVIVFGVLWLAVAGATRYSSVASLIACSAIPPFFWFWGARVEALVFLLLVVLTFIMHRGNIARLAQGTENKIGQKAGAPTGG